MRLCGVLGTGAGDVPARDPRAEQAQKEGGMSQGAEVRDQRSGVGDNASMPVWQLCPGCGVEVCGGGYCPDCVEMGIALDDRYADWDAARAAQDPRAPRRSKIWRRLEDFAWFAVVWALFVFIAWQVMPWFVALYSIWFGGH